MFRLLKKAFIFMLTSLIPYLWRNSSHFFTVLSKSSKKLDKNLPILKVEEAILSRADSQQLRFRSWRSCYSDEQLIFR